MKSFSALLSFTAVLLALSGVEGHQPIKASGKVASTWWASWHASDFPASKLSWSKYNRVVYSFAETTPDVNKLDLGDSGDQLLKGLVSAAHQHNVQAAVAIGGWTGSRFFSSAVATPANRTAFTKTILTLAQTYQLDGIDFDWESPVNQGIGCNLVSPHDTANFLALLRELRAHPLGRALTITAATGINPFAGPDGDPLTDVRAFTDVLDYIEVMNYDIWGSWSDTVGPNAPLNDTCAPPADQQGSAVSALRAWSTAGMPAHQIVLGVAAYGHSFRVAKKDAIVNGSMVAYPPFNASAQPAGDKWDDPAGIDECGNDEAVGGLFDFWGLIQAGFLTSEGNRAPGIIFRYDDCTKTPYVYDATSEIMIAFDNAPSFREKGTFIRSAGLRGFSMWEAGGDSNDILLDAIQSESRF
ncbi:chitinase [Gloeophyllum trabeum ATCC 11539]|uniref:Chitinase n=1 Tax=Gloeophyllum trabeum (strain ATCC 11539 / FP-39264 / Madison 617) TaxID=670483 RepID=S7RR78_GLOTA|nr:chitinase [Gloeophyllum trabeum ATCC 11539]EPQ57125.1 chitinase [Gloeophyllum trabeum ATCC 11539]